MARPAGKSFGPRPGLGFEAVSMTSGEDWLYRPVLANCIKYESLLDGTLDLLDIADLNEALDVKVENERRAMDAAKRK